MHTMCFDHIHSPLLSLIPPRPTPYPLPLPTLCSSFLFFQTHQVQFIPVHVLHVYVWPSTGGKLTYQGAMPVKNSDFPSSRSQQLLFPPQLGVRVHESLPVSPAMLLGLTWWKFCAGNHSFSEFLIQQSYHAQVLIPSGLPQPLAVTVFPPLLLQWSLNLVGMECGMMFYL